MVLVILDHIWAFENWVPMSLLQFPGDEQSGLNESHHLRAGRSSNLINNNTTCSNTEEIFLAEVAPQQSSNLSNKVRRLANISDAGGRLRPSGLRLETFYSRRIFFSTRQFLCRLNSAATFLPGDIFPSGQHSKQQTNVYASYPDFHIFFLFPPQSLLVVTESIEDALPERATSITYNDQLEGSDSTLFTQL